MIPDTFIALTPFGAVGVEFPEEGGSILSGPNDAVLFLTDVMGRCVNGMGMSMTPQSLEPSDLVNFCQPPGSAVRIIPPADYIDGDEGLIPMLDSVHGDVLRLSEALATASGIERVRIASELLVVSESARIPLAKAYFKATLQDSTVQTVIGPVKIIGGTWKEMRRGMAHDGIKAGLLPMVPDILSRGYLVGDREPDKKNRTDYVAFYFIRMDGIKVGSFFVDAGVTVGEREEGAFEYRMNAYSLGHSEMAKWQKKIAPEAPRGKEPRTSEAMGSGEPLLDDIMGYQDDECNIFILAVRDQKGEPVLDSVG